MKFGVREICDVVLRAKATQKVGNKIFYKHEPVIYFDTLKTSSLEGTATTVYATGGRGNARQMAWEGERTVTFTMEDALISPAGFMILSGAGLIEADSNNKIKVHMTERTKVESAGASGVTIKLSQKPYYIPADVEAGTEDDLSTIYVMLLRNGEVVSEPYIPKSIDEDGVTIALNPADDLTHDDEEPNPFGKGFQKDDIVLVDYYVEKPSGVSQIEITPDKFGGNYYLEASTLFRNTDGVDMPAEFIIPNCKIQSSFNFTMASSGDPSTFTFTMDAFPDYTRFDSTKKVLAAIQIISETSTETGDELTRDRTKSEREYNPMTGEFED